MVIVAEEVEEAVEGEDPQLGGVGVSRLAGLPPGHAGGDGDVAQERVAVGHPVRRREREDVSGAIDPGKVAVQPPDRPVVDERDAEGSTGRARGRGPQPCRQARGPDGTAGAVGDRDVESGGCGWRPAARSCRPPGACCQPVAGPRVWVSVGLITVRQEMRRTEVLPFENAS